MKGHRSVKYSSTLEVPRFSRFTRIDWQNFVKNRNEEGNEMAKSPHRGAQRSKEVVAG